MYTQTLSLLSALKDGSGRGYRRAERNGFDGQYRMESARHAPLSASSFLWPIDIADDRREVTCLKYLRPGKVGAKPPFLVLPIIVDLWNSLLELSPAAQGL